MTARRDYTVTESRLDGDECEITAASIAYCCQGITATKDSNLVLAIHPSKIIEDVIQEVESWGIEIYKTEAVAEYAPGE